MENHRERFVVLGADTSTGIAVVKALAPRCGVLFACFRSVKEVCKQREILKLLGKYSSIRICIIPDDKGQTFSRCLEKLKWYSIIVEGVICMSDWKTHNLFQSIRPFLRDRGKFIAVGEPTMALPEDAIAKERGITTYFFSSANAPMLVQSVL